MRNVIENFEKNSQKIRAELERTSVIEFCHDEKQIKDRIQKLQDSLDAFSIYLPKTKVTVEDEVKAKKDI